MATDHQRWLQANKKKFIFIDYQKTRVADLKLLISDPETTWRVISDPDPARGSFRIRILVCEIFA